MGMDVYGTAPTSKTGEYFRNNVWWWSPLANYICGVAPAIANRCPRWHHNEGMDWVGMTRAPLPISCKPKSTAAEQKPIGPTMRAR
jgi:hypothetical protein